MISQKKHERFLYTLLSIYTLLVMVFMLLINGFFVKPKAFTDGFHYSISETATDKGDIVGQKTTNVYSNGRTLAIFCTDPELKEIVENMVSSEYGSGMSFVGLVVRKPDQGLGGTLSRSSSGGGVNAYKSYFINDSNPTLYSYFQKYNINTFFEDRSGLVEFYLNGVNSSFPDQVISSKILDDVEYVDNGNDLRKYLNENDDSVVKTGDPDNPQLPEDDSLPVPQKLGTDIQNDNVGTPPFISGSWENPGAIYASFDASEVEVEIEYKPVFQLYKKMFNLKLAKVSSDDWIPVTKTQISNYTLNRFILYNARSGYPNPFDSQTIHSGSLTDDVESVGNSDGYNGMYNPLSARIANGTNWRIRYIIGNKTSLWVVFHVNSIGSIKNNESVSFENASGDPVSADDVNYTNSAQTQTVDKLNVNNFFDSLSAAINGIFNTANNSFTAQDTEGSKGFYSMFKATFEKFPVFWTFFCLGLIVAILLRILGR